MKVKTSRSLFIRARRTHRPYRQIDEDEVKARVDLQRIADDRDRLLEDDDATLAQFDVLSARELAANVAIRRAARARPRLQKARDPALEAEQTRKAGVYRAQLLEASGRIEAAIRSLIQENLAAQSISSRRRPSCR